MMLNVITALGLLSILCGQVVQAKKQAYEGYKLYEVMAKNFEQSQALFNLSELTPSLDFLRLYKLPNVPMSVVVAPEEQSMFEEELKRNLIQTEVVSDDLFSIIRAEQVPSPRIDFRITDLEFNRFYRYYEINNYLDFLEDKYPKRVKVKTIGISYEGKLVKSITISNGLFGNKKVILIDAGIHAREWMAPATALYIIYKLVEKFNENKDLLQKYNWVIIPLVNPDGYEYSMFTNRMWRKTRKPNFMLQSKSDSPWFGRVFNKCDNKYYHLSESFFDGKPRDVEGFGTDGNRNFDSHWGEVGASSKGCDKTYRGPANFSELETRAVRDVMLSLQDRVKMYLSLHSHGAMIVYPWGFQSTPPDNWQQIDEVASIGAAAIERLTNRKYRVGTANSMLYKASGSSMDYALEKVGIPISMTMELPPNRFDPNPSEIRIYAKEGWSGIKAMAEKVQKLYS